MSKIRENAGLQNAGLLVLDSGGMKRDAWTSSFRDIVFALNFPTALVVPPIVTPPEQKPDTVVQIPDPNLRAAIAEELGKSPNAPITVGDMEKLRELDVPNRGIQDLTGLQFAANLDRLNLGWWEGENQVSDLSPIAGLIGLRGLGLTGNPVSDLSPLAGLINLECLLFSGTNVSDLSPLAGLTNLKDLYFHGVNVSDLSPLAGLINLELIHSWKIPVSDLSPLARLTKLQHIYLPVAEISDLTPLAGLMSLKETVS